ncbi:MAG TPA: hypothetical protein VJW20_00685 [Candidatus Angelobacter sp.]|nr:hypothetical protein [Candidatus Angelobacter sp.]
MNTNTIDKTNVQMNILIAAKENSAMKFAATGAIYGTGLTLLAFLAAGYGHGTYVVLGLVSAPLGLLGIEVAFLSLPFLWTGIFLLVRRNGGIFFTLMLLHYLGAAVLLATQKFSDQFGDWDYFAIVWSKSRILLVACCIWYLVGQVFLWRSFLKKRLGPASTCRRSSAAMSHKF